MISKHANAPKDFDLWNAKKKEVHSHSFCGHVHEREIWWCALGVNIGHEEDGKNHEFERPVLIIKKWSRDTVIILPLTTKVKKNVYHFTFSHDGVEFAVILSQIRIVSTNRLRRKIRKMHPRLFDEVCGALADLLFPNRRTPAKRGSPEPNGHL